MTAPGRSIICIVGRTGSGKSVLAKSLEETGRYEETVSVTTREPRPGEISGVHYRFVTESEFLKIRESKGLIESAKFSGKYYGTAADEVERISKTGKTTIMVVEPQGADNIRKWAQTNDCAFVSVYIDCDERLSAERMLVRFLDEVENNLDSSLKDRQRVVDRYASRMANITGPENSWSGLVPYNIVLDPQLSAEDTRGSIKSIDEAIRNGADKNDDFDYKTTFDHILASGALEKTDGVSLFKIRNILETVILLGEPLPDAQTMTSWILDPGSLPRIDKEALIDACESGDQSAVRNTITDFGGHSLSEGLMALFSAHPYSKLDRILSDEKRLKAFVLGVQSRYTSTPRVLLMREPGSRHTIIESIYRAHNPTVLNSLKAAGFNVNESVNETGETLLHLAVRNENKAWVKELVLAGANVGIKDENKESPLMLAQRWRVSPDIHWALNENNTPNSFEAMPC